MDVDYNIPCYVITTIPPHQYHMGFESELKIELNKIVKLFTLEQILNFDFDQIFENFCEKFG